MHMLIKIQSGLKNKSWEVLCKLNNDSIIYASLPRHTEANMLSKNINDELYIKNFYLLG